MSPIPAAGHGMGVGSDSHPRGEREEGHRVGHMSYIRLRVAEDTGCSHAAGAGAYRKGGSPEEVGAEEADIPRHNHLLDCSRPRRNGLDRSHRSLTCSDPVVTGMQV